MSSTDLPLTIAHDPRPVRPVEPDPGDCCGDGCCPCVYDYYADELERYKAQLAAWLARHPEVAEK